MRYERSVKYEPRSPHCPSCAQIVNSLEQRRDLRTLPDLYIFECSACDVSHIEEASFRIGMVSPVRSVRCF